MAPFRRTSYKKSWPDVHTGIRFKNFLIGLIFVPGFGTLLFLYRARGESLKSKISHKTPSPAPPEIGKNHPPQKFPLFFVGGPKDQKNSRFRARLKILSGEWNFRASHPPWPCFWWGNWDVEIEIFERDQKFRSRSNFFNRWALWVGFLVTRPKYPPPLSRDRCSNTPVALCFLWYRRLSLLHPHFLP